MDDNDLAVLRAIKSELEVRIVIAAAVSRQSGALGLEGKIPWKPHADDIALLRSRITGRVVVMGANTFTGMADHYPSGLRFIIENCVVVTYNRDAKASLALQMENAIRAAALKGRILMVLGGAETYRNWMSLADEMNVTLYDYEGPADSFYPFPKGELS